MLLHKADCMYGWTYAMMQCFKQCLMHGHQQEQKLCAQCLQQCFRAHCAHTIANIYYSTAWTCAYDMRGRDTTACTLHMCSCCAVLSVTPLFSWCVVPQMDSSLLESIHAMRNEAYSCSWLWCNVLNLLSSRLAPSPVWASKLFPG